MEKQTIEKDFDLLDVTLACIQQASSSNDQMLIVTAQRSTVDGISLPVYIRSMSQLQSGGDKTRYVYQLVVHDLSGDINIPSYVGERVNETTIKLKIEGKVKMTDVELADYRKKNPKDTKREYRSVYVKDIELCVGMEIRYTNFNTSYKKPSGMAFRAGSFVIARGLRVTEKIGGGYGAQWEISSFAEQPNAPSVATMMKHLAAHNYLLNVSRSNPEYHEHENETDADKKLRETLSANPAQIKGYQRETLLMANLPLNLRSRANQLIVMPLRGHLMDAEDAPLIFANDVSAFFQRPVWQAPFIHTCEDEAKTVVKAVTAQSTVVLTVRKRNSVQLVCVQVRFYDKQTSLLDIFGIINVPLFAILAPILVPACEGHVAAGMNIQGSNDLCETLMLEETGMHFGVSAWARSMYVNLVSGIVRCGFPIDYHCALSAIEAVMNGVTNFADNPVNDFAEINPLNKASAKPPVINLREATINMSDISDGYDFFLVTTQSAEDMKEKCDDYSAVIMGTTAGSLGDLASLKNNYTVFAIRTQLVEDNHVHDPLIDVLEDEDFVDAFKTGRKRKLEAALSREQVIAQEAAALNAGFFDDD